MKQMTSETNNPNPENSNNKFRNRRIGAAVIVTLVLLGGIEGLRQSTDLDFSETTKEYRVRAHETIWDAAKHVEGVNGVDIRRVYDYIEKMPANAKILSNGIQADETVEIPISVTP